MDLAHALSSGTAQPVALVAAALLLGALHGLEPGHSKTMMAAFIIAVRGTVGQAILLGLSAAVSHTIIVWVLALLALRFGAALIGEDMEAWFMIASGLLILGIAAWLFLQTRRRHHRPHPQHSHHHDHLHPHHGHHHHAEDAHAHGHARDIAARFGDGRTTSAQTILFGLTGGLIPCSAAITVLLLCLQINRFWLGVGLVSAFSIGLAASLVAVGVTAAVGVRLVAARTDRLDRVLSKAPYVSAGVIAVIGGIMIALGTQHLQA